MQNNFILFIWLGLLILFLIIEFATAQLTTIWFACGALAALLLEAFGINDLLIQIIVFALISLVALIFTRPLVKKYVTKKALPTNADMCIGQKALVTDEIDNAAAKGLVKVNGSVWSARTADGSVKPEGSEVTVLAIEGVKLIVE